ncbi:serine/threonine protein kinase [Metabacillus endolithicus]|uniref:Serine/threonine protein kinase n=1 Tax=Metabacillus endolithicus TaxID=1535204 RepID=A0ABW5C3I5_9BACI|nr:serine/threonine protein kinase [Metabacillus endolithicus]UPG62582.1 serine/threonine protein kinase [Metabacillus endolithicus]
MEKEWLVVDKLLSKIKITSNPNNKPVTIHGSLDDLRCIGVGTDAAVFQYAHKPQYAFKLYAEDKKEKIQTEAEVYQRLKNSPFFATCYYAVYERYLVLSFEEGITLYDCVLQGIHIPHQVIVDVEDARDFAKEQGLNPRDIHLKNILLQQGRAKVIDVSEYGKEGNDLRWEHLKNAYEQYYDLIDGKTIPFWLMQTVQRWYNQKNFGTFDDFMKDVLRLTVFKK